MTPCFPFCRQKATALQFSVLYISSRAFPMMLVECERGEEGVDNQLEGRSDFSLVVTVGHGRGEDLNLLLVLDRGDDQGLFGRYLCRLPL